MSSGAWTYWSKLISLALRGIRAQRLRALLSAFGIMVGIAAVIAILALGEGAREEALQQVRHLGTNNIIIRSILLSSGKSAPVTNDARGLSIGDAIRLERISPQITALAPVKEQWTMAAWRDREVRGRLVGTTPAVQETSKLRVATGRFFVGDDSRQRRQVCVLGAQISRDLFRLDSPLGKRVQVGKDWFQVVGVLQSRALLGGEKAVVRAQDINRDIYIPLEAMVSIAAPREAWPVNELALVIAGETHVLETARLVRTVLERTHRGVRDYEVIVPLELLAQRRQTQKLFNAVLAGVAALSLLVGGTGIMNIMLATVTERTPEIGVRRAVGATAQDIVLQFVTETATLTFLGGITGVVLGVATSWGLHLFGGWPVQVSVATVGGVLAVSILCGLVFGLYPALKAAAADPIEALRYE
ncbi:MAG: ABC transporter permease [Candidatus Binatia bacterium]